MNTLAQKREDYSGPEETYEQMVITTDNKWHNFLYRYEVPEKALREHFAHLSEDEYFDGFFHYRGSWYHISDFSVFTRTLGGKKWQGYAPDTFFSGVLVNLSDDGEQYMVGRYYS